MLIVNFFPEMLFRPTSSLALADVYVCHCVCVCVCVCACVCVCMCVTCYHQDSKRHLSSLPRLEGLDHMMKEITEDTEEDRRTPEEDGASQGELAVSLGLLQLLAGSLWCICFEEQ